MPKILLVTAVGSQTPLQLAAEVRAVQEALGPYTSFLLEHVGEVSPRTFIAAIRERQPDIIHFAGHGAGGKDLGLSLVGEFGQPIPMTREQLVEILTCVPRRPRLILLNACYSAEMAKALSDLVEVVIGVHGAIGDPAALDFARSFYAGIATSCSVGDAFSLARIELAMSGEDRDLIGIDCAENVDPRRITFHARPELMARFRLSDGKPEVVRGHYQIELWVRGADQNIDSVSYEIHHDSYDAEDRYWEVTRSESPEFLTDDYTSTGDVTIRITAWARDRGLGAECTLSQALRRNYAGTSTPDIASAIDAVSAA
ncbi:CHAT domain-containing protein [Nostoc linckia]|uniref:CHAT domain-containing protein n=1 Tax=Nostoc linckia TaxID=92942 RepID=UPI0015D4947C|nr:CHAT domain-containing protein [Nostoc linckia]